MAVATGRSGEPLTEDLSGIDAEREPATGSDPAVSDAATSGAPEVDTTGADRPRWVVPTAIGLVVLLVGFLVVASFFGIRVVGGFADSMGRSNALDAAREVATNLTTFDAATAEEDIARLVETTTPAFAAGLDGDREAFIRSLREGKVKMTGTVTEAGVASYDDDTAQVIVAVRSAVNSGGGEQGRDYRLNLTMVHQGGSWLASKVEFLA